MASTLCCAIAIVCAGCATQQQQRQMPPPTTTPPPAPAPAPAPQTGCTAPTAGLVKLTKVMPAEASLGSEFTAELHLTAADCVANVVVEDTVPAGATYVRSDPAANVTGTGLIWKLGNMDAGESRTIQVTFRADKEGTLVNCASVSADPRTCAAIFIGKASLAIEKTGPETALVGADVTYTIVVNNTGNTAASDVVVTDPVPDGFSHASGQKELTFNVGNLAPGQARQMSVTLKANKRGKICNTATANSSNAGKVNAEACTTIVQPGVAIAKVTDDKQLLINRTATYQVVVTNTGDTTLTGVMVTDTAAAETAIVSADGATVTGNTATWNVGELKAGETKAFTVKVLSKEPGKFCDTASVTTAEGLRIRRGLHRMDRRDRRAGRSRG